MLLIIHAGLHKTASTYLQGVLNRNRAALLAANLYLQSEGIWLANHSTAFAARLGDYRGIEEHLALATKTRRAPLILTSENFESLIFTPAFARGLELAAASRGVTEIEWHFVLRDPGQYFASQYAQIAQHAYVDFLAMFEGVVREGRFDVTSVLRRHPDVWSHCFDYETHIKAFAQVIGGTIVFHDYRDDHPFPGHAIMERFTGGKVQLEPPTGEGVRNERNSPERVEALYEERAQAALFAEGLSDSTRAALRARIHVDRRVIDECAAAVSARFAPGMERLLAMKTMPGAGA